MDIRLPGIDGLETTRRIMAERPTPIVVIADAVEDSSLGISMNALRAGALSVVEKPVATTHAGYEAVVGRDLHAAPHHGQVPVIRRRPIGAEWSRRAPLGGPSGTEPRVKAERASASSWRSPPPPAGRRPSPG